MAGEISKEGTVFDGLMPTFRLATRRVRGLFHRKPGPIEEIAGTLRAWERGTVEAESQRHREETARLEELTRRRHALDLRCLALEEAIRHMGQVGAPGEPDPVNSTGIRMERILARRHLAELQLELLTFEIEHPEIRGYYWAG